ncbi:MAG: DUF5131 family protein [Acidimicrobiales bacterium]
MSDKSGIEWCDATWNPVVGCKRVSPGCDHCYAIRDGARLQHLPAYEDTISGADWTGLVRCLPERLGQPLAWKRPRRIFVNSMGDLFHPDVPEAFIEQVFVVMSSAERHTFQLLTKRPQAMSALLGRWRDRGYLFGDAAPAAPMERTDLIGSGARLPLPNLWLGTSIESDRYTFRADHLRSTPASVRFLSLEPLLGPLPSLDLTGIDWVIVGGESGPDARPMHPDWARDIRNRCVDVGIPFLFKQWGTWVPLGEFPTGSVPMPRESRSNKARLIGDERPVYMLRASRTGDIADPHRLDGRVWNEYPSGQLMGARS